MVTKVPDAVEILSKISIDWVGCTSVADDRQTDGRQHMFAKNRLTFGEVMMKRLTKL